jgi:hypothetical protein
MRFNALIISLLLLIPLALPAQLCGRTNQMKQHCGTCHTMHNSQDEAEMTGGLGQLRSLLRKPCYGCHYGTNTAGSGSMPMVWSSSDPQYGATGTEAGVHTNLAGGDFYWVALGDDLKGHNVEGIATQSSRYPPGNTTQLVNSLTCAGRDATNGIYGCHGRTNVADETGAMSRAHHADDTLATDGSTFLQSYRFLEGVAGKEDADYELNVSAGDHNQYKGVARGSDSDSSGDNTISSLCARCHGDFHFGAGNLGVFDETGTFGADPWIRHPVDVDMNGIGGEYADYGGAGINAYNIETPVASADVSTGLSTVLQVAGDAIITCVSCHRAHGSPYDYNLRWDYASWPGGGTNGCGHCHTAKN